MMNGCELTRFGVSFFGLVLSMALTGCHLIFPYEKQDDDAAVDAPSRNDRRGIDSPVDSPSADRKTVDVAKPKPDTWPDGPGPDRGGCNIGGKHVPTNSSNPSDVCQRCDPSKSVAQWTTLKKHVVTLAGTGSPGLQDGPVASAKFNAPRDIALAAAGTLFVTDGENAVIRKISSGQVTTFAGSGTVGFKDGSLLSAQFHDPHGIVLLVGSSGGQELYVADSGNCRIRRIDLSAVSTFAGMSKCMYMDELASAAGFVYPRAVAAATGASGKIDFYIADDTGHRIRKMVWEAYNGKYSVTTLAGDGTAGYQDGSSARFNGPKSLAVEQESASLTVYVADGGNNVIRKITDNGITNTVTFAGSLTGQSGFADGGATTKALFWYPHGLVIESSTVMYVADPNNYRIRKIAYDGTGWQVTTVAGNGLPGGADGPALNASFSFPHGLAIDAAGRIYIGDREGHTIRVYCP